MLRAKLSNSSLRLLQTFAKRLVAFANTKGGTLYIGVEDNGTVVGVNSSDRVTLQINNMVRDSIKPDITMFVHYETQVIDDKQIIAVTVQEGTDRPYYLGSNYRKVIAPKGRFDDIKEYLVSSYYKKRNLPDSVTETILKAAAVSEEIYLLQPSLNKLEKIIFSEIPSEPVTLSDFKYESGSPIGLVILGNHEYIGFADIQHRSQIIIYV